MFFTEALAERHCPSSCARNSLNRRSLIAQLRGKGRHRRILALGGNSPQHDLQDIRGSGAITTGLPARGGNTSGTPRPFAWWQPLQNSR